MNHCIMFSLLAAIAFAPACATVYRDQEPDAVAGPELHGLDFDPYEYYGAKPKPLNPNGKVSRL